MEIFCLKCKKKIETINPIELITKNNRKFIKGQCKDCNTNKNQFIKSKIGSGIINNESEFEEVYYDPKQGFSGINELARKTGKSQKEVDKFLHEQDVYTKHKPVKQKFQRERVYVHYPDQQ